MMLLNKIFVNAILATIALFLIGCATQFHQSKKTAPDYIGYKKPNVRLGQIQADLAECRHKI